MALRRICVPSFVQPRTPLRLLRYRFGAVPLATEHSRHLAHSSLEHDEHRDASHLLRVVDTSQTNSTGTFFDSDDGQSLLSTLVDDMGKGRHLTDSERQMRTLQQMLGITNAEDLQDEMKDAVFVCIDVEAYEHAQEKITEIGVAVLDTRDLVGLTLDSPRDAWLSKFKHAHYRMVDYAELRNKSFVQGCPDSFNFGVTTWYAYSRPFVRGLGTLLITYTLPAGSTSATSAKS